MDHTRVKTQLLHHACKLVLIEAGQGPARSVRLELNRSARLIAVIVAVVVLVSVPLVAVVILHLLFLLLDSLFLELLLAVLLDSGHDLVE